MKILQKNMRVYKVNHPPPTSEKPPPTSESVSDLTEKSRALRAEETKRTNRGACGARMEAATHQGSHQGRQDGEQRTRMQPIGLSVIGGRGALLA